MICIRRIGIAMGKYILVMSFFKKKSDRYLPIPNVRKIG